MASIERHGWLLLSTVVMMVPDVAGAWGVGPGPGPGGYTPPSTTTHSAPPPSDRYRVGNLYYDKNSIQNVLLSDAAAAPYVEEARALRRQGRGLMAGGIASMAVFTIVGTVLLVVMIDGDTGVAMGAGLGVMLGGMLGVSMPLMLVGAAKGKASKRKINEAINVYNSGNPAEPIVIEQQWYSWNVRPWFALGGGGVRLSTTF